MPYTRLRADLIVDTTRRLRARVQERFPGSGLSRVCEELLSVSERAAATSAWIEKPNLWLRAAVGFCILLLVFGGGAAFLHIRWNGGASSIYEVLQGIEAGVNDLIFIGIGIAFLVTWENRIKRNRALKALHALRSLAHVIDMHQLTKDPERVMNPGQGTPSSPERQMSAFLLTRYLDYCSEMLSVISKIAALYVQSYDDDVTLAAVGEIETLTSGLSRKIWQKITIVERVEERVPAEPFADD